LELKSTHTLSNGTPVVQKTGKYGIYWVDVKNNRIKTNGEVPVPVSGAVPVVPLEQAAESTAWASPVSAGIDLKPEQPKVQDDWGYEVAEEAEAVTCIAIPFAGYSVALAAIQSGPGYYERGGYVANRCGDRAAILCIPVEGGGHNRFRVEFPAIMVLPCEAVN
jgi:hypothetical protein